MRLEWGEVPAPVRQHVESVLASAVVAAENQPGGFSPGVAARCQLADGRRVFVKCVSAEQNASSVAMHRREAEVAAGLPSDLPVPALLEVVDDGRWVTLVFEEVIGRPPQQPWSLADLAATFEALDDLSALATPCPVNGLPTFAERYGPFFDGFRRLAGGELTTERLDLWTRQHLQALADLESRWEEAATGSSLVHSDLRADNLLVTPDGTIVVVDWSHACIGAAWLDKACMLPSVGLDGGPSPLGVEAVLRPFAHVDREVVDRVIVALAGYFTFQGSQPDPTGLPTLRAFQRAQAEITRQWIAGRRTLG